MGKTDTNNLGQYFTPPNVAQYMSHEIVRSLPNKGKVVDPCIGMNIFFSYLGDEDISLLGVEIDANLISKKTRNFFNHPHRKLIIGDFIDQQFDANFDGVIMNPPYTRQEKVSLATKQKLTAISKDAGIAMSAKANLYVYFVLKGLLMLKEGGTLVAITYDSWLYSSFGENFKKFLLRHFYLKRIIHFKHDAFEGVDVGATLIIIEKSKSSSAIEYFEYESATDFPAQSNTLNYHNLTPDDLIDFNDYTTIHQQLDFSESFFQPLEKLSTKTPWRGSSSPSNKHFLFKSSDKGLTPILKKTPQSSYSVSAIDCVYAFVFTEDSPNSSRERMESIKRKILQSDISDSLRNKIDSQPRWYTFPIKPGGDIIFNYYYRDNPRFIMNADNLPTMGNYYNINCSEYAYETFALLNSSLTRYALIKSSKSQGKGLKKIQLYKFSKVNVLNLNTFNEADLSKLNALAKKLSDGLKAEQALLSIDEIVLKHYCHMAGEDYNKVKSIIHGEIKNE